MPFRNNFGIELLDFGATLPKATRRSHLRFCSDTATFLVDWEAVVLAQISLISFLN